MSNRRLVLPILAGSILLAACGSDPPPPPAPPPADPTTTTADPTPPTPMEPEGLTPAEIDAERRRLAEVLEEMVFFEYDRSEITPEAEVTLRAKVPILRENPELRIRIEGHADERGSTEYNLALASERAESAKEFLVGFGLSESRFSTVSYGEERPLVNQSNERAWARNRRDEFVITAGRNSIRVSGR